MRTGMVEYTATFQTGEAGRHDEGEPSDVARRAESRRPPHHRAGRTRNWATSAFPAAGRAMPPAARCPDRTTTTSWCRSPGMRTGRSITGRVMARIINASGKNSQAMLVYTNPMPYKPASLDTTEASLTTHASETIDGKIGGHGGNRVGRLGLRQMRCRPSVSRHARSDTDLLEERLRSQPALSGGVHGEGSAGARDRLRRLPRCRLVLQAMPRRTTPARPIRWPTACRGRSPAASRSPAISSAASCISASTRTRPAGRSMTARGRSSPAGASRSTCASPCRTACFDALRGRQRGSAMVGRRARSGARVARRGHPRPLQCQPHLPEDRRAFRRRRGMGPEADAGVGRLRRRHRPAAARQCAALLHSEHAAWRRPRRLFHRFARAACLSRHRMGPGRAGHQSDAAHRDGECAARPFPQLGDEGRGAACEPLSDAQGRRHSSTRRHRRWASRRCRACRRTRRPASSIPPSTTTSGRTSTRSTARAWSR